MEKKNFDLPLPTRISQKNIYDIYYNVYKNNKY